MKLLLSILLAAIPTGAQYVPTTLSAQQHGGAVAPAYVREVKTFNVTTASTTTAITSLSNNIPSGHEAVLGWKQDTNNTTTVSSVSDNAGGNTWSCATANTADTAITEGICYSFLSTTIATTNTITITWANATNSYKVGFVEDVSGTTAVDASVVNTGSLFGTSSSTAQITTSLANTIIFAMVGAETATNTYSVGTSGFTLTAASPITSGGSRFAYLVYRVVSSSGTYNAVGGGGGGAWSGNTNWIGSTIAFH